MEILATEAAMQRSSDAPTVLSVADDPKVDEEDTVATATRA